MSNRAKPNHMKLQSLFAERHEKLLIIWDTLHRWKIGCTKFPSRWQDLFWKQKRKSNRKFTFECIITRRTEFACIEMFSFSSLCMQCAQHSSHVAAYVQQFWTRSRVKCKDELFWRNSTNSKFKRAACFKKLSDVGDSQRLINRNRDEVAAERIFNPFDGFFCGIAGERNVQS